MAKVSEDRLLALKAQYLTAHSEYDRCIAALSRAGLGSAVSLPEQFLDSLAKAFGDLQLARKEYREALFSVAFDGNQSLN